jgi:hypothetical protein
MIQPTPEESQDLLRLLALKRHEQPPPGYFESFSDLVIARIEAGENSTSQPWWRSLWLTFQTKPVLASAYCLLAAGVSLFALSMVELASGPAEDQTVLAAGVWPPLNSRASAELTDRVAFDRFSSTLNPLFSEGTVGDSNGEPPRFLLDGRGLRTRTVSFQY